MTTWFTADWHLFHENIVKSCERPFKGHHQMNERLEESFLEVVRDDDTVYFLGDLTMRGPKQIDGIRKIVMRLPGHKHFVPGNHDRLKIGSYLRMGFESVHSSLDLKRGGVTYHLTHDPKNTLAGARYVICGHVHNKWRCRKEPVPTVNIGVDLWGFAPVRFSEVTQVFQRLMISTPS